MFILSGCVNSEMLPILALISPISRKGVFSVVVFNKSFLKSSQMSSE